LWQFTSVGLVSGSIAVQSRSQDFVFEQECTGGQHRPRPVVCVAKASDHKSTKFYFDAKAEVNLNFGVIIIIHTVMLLIYEV